MPQEMNILRCSSCKMYQVHIVKKAKKWQCKFCNFKQTFGRVYFQGSGKDCRVLVQQLNLASANEFENSHDCSNQSVVENRFEKYLDSSDDVSEPSTSSCSGLERFRFSMDSDCSNSQSEYANESVHLNNSDESSDYDVKTEYEYVSEEMIENVSDNEDDNKDNDFHRSNTTETKNIFETNEDIDLTIDF